MNEAFSVLIPAYNEAGSIASVIQGLRATLQGREFEIIVIDDGSGDQTARIALEQGVRVLQHKRNRGYGASLKSGILAGRHECLVIMDADGTYPAESIPELVAALKDADMVVGMRAKENIPLLRRPAKWILRRLDQYITAQKIPDLNSGMRAFRRSLAMRYFSVVSDRFSFTTTLTVALLSDNYVVTYLPIEYHQRVGKSKIVPWDFVNFMILTLRLSMLFNPLKIFIPASFLCFVTGAAKFILDIMVAAEKNGGNLGRYILTHRTISITAMILLLAGLQILLIGMMSDGLARKIGLQNPLEYRTHAVVELEPLPPSS
ncbi:glycosyltransferase family 2 protein [bacterium]|nr:glycosyltransferase family 2 protein [bacterium]